MPSEESQNYNLGSTAVGPPPFLTLELGSYQPPFWPADHPGFKELCPPPILGTCSVSVPRSKLLGCLQGMQLGSKRFGSRFQPRTKTRVMLSGFFYFVFSPYYHSFKRAGFFALALCHYHGDRYSSHLLKNMEKLFYVLSMANHLI